MRNYADEAMGLIETLGMVPAIYGADAMLKAADVACVVANGLPEAKAQADEVIGGNDEDGVAMAIARMEGLAC